MSSLLVPSKPNTFYVPITESDDGKALAEIMAERPWFPKIHTLMEKVKPTEYYAIAQVTVQMLHTQEHINKVKKIKDLKIN